MTDKHKKNWKKIKDEADLENLEDVDEEKNADIPALDHPSYLALEEKLTVAEQQVHENWEKSVRAVAELDNVRRRAERDVENAHRYGISKLITSLLPVLDSLEQAIELSNKTADAAMVEGLLLTQKLFLDVLQQQKVEQINPLGDLFNPQEHEAMTMQVAPDAVPNSVVAVFQKGYKLHDRVIRPARVIVAKAS